ncbi:hypothetical protein HK096_007384, partial [Nowakowskiella sp. JEL0078]
MIFVAKIARLGKLDIFVDRKVVPVIYRKHVQELMALAHQIYIWLMGQHVQVLTVV